MSCKITAAAAAFRHVFSPYISQQESFLGSVQYRQQFIHKGLYIRIFLVLKQKDHGTEF